MKKMKKKKKIKNMSFFPCSRPSSWLLDGALLSASRMSARNWLPLGRHLRLLGSGLGLLSGGLGGALLGLKQLVAGELGLLLLLHRVGHMLGDGVHRRGLKAGVRQHVLKFGELRLPHLGTLPGGHARALLLGLPRALQQRAEQR